MIDRLFYMLAIKGFLVIIRILANHANITTEDLKAAVSFVDACDTFADITGQKNDELLALMKEVINEK